MDLANLTRDPLMLRLALSTATARAILEAAIEKSFTEEFLGAVAELTEGAPAASLVLGSLVTMEFSELFTPRSAQLRFAEATGELRKRLNDDIDLVQQSLAILAKVAQKVFADYRKEIIALLKQCINHCHKEDFSRILAEIEREMFGNLTRWHGTARGWVF